MVSKFGDILNVDMHNDRHNVIKIRVVTNFGLTNFSHVAVLAVLAIVERWHFIVIKMSATLVVVIVVVEKS